MRGLYTIAAVLACLLLCPAAKADDTRGLSYNRLIDAVYLYEDGDYAAAADTLSLITAQDSTFDAAWFYSALCSYAAGDAVAAETGLRRAVALDTTNTYYYDTLISFLEESDRGAEAVQLYRSLVDRYPRKYRNAYTLSGIGNMVADEGDDSLAISYFSEALLLDPGYTPASMGLAECYRMRGNYAAFFVSLDPVMRDPYINPVAKADYINALIDRVNGGFYRVWHVQIDSLVSSFVQTHPDDSSALFTAGGWFYSTGQKPLGKSYYTHYINQHQDDIEALKLAVELCYVEEDYNGALDGCDKMIALAKEQGDNEELSGAWCTRGDICALLDYYSSAWHCYGRSLRANPDNSVALNNYAYNLSLMHWRLRKALKMSLRSLELDSESANNLDTCGWILHLLGRNSEARLYYKKAMIHGASSEPAILYNYATVLDALGEKGPAQYYRGLADSASDKEARSE